MTTDSPERAAAKTKARQAAADARTKSKYRPADHLPPHLTKPPTCATCGGTMAIIEPDQTTHPGCTDQVPVTDNGVAT